MTALKQNNAAPVSAPGTCVTIYETHENAEGAVKALGAAGFDMKKLSIVGTDYRTEENVVGYYNMGDRVKFWGSKGAFWGGLWGVLFGSAFFFVPGLGPLVLAGPIVGMVVGGLQGAVTVGGMSALGAVLFSIGVPKDTVLEYETALKSHKFLLIVHGEPSDAAQARETLARAGVAGVKIDVALPGQTPADK